MTVLTFVAFSLWLYFASVAGVTNQRCKPVGTKSITISWKSSPTNYSNTAFKVYFRKPSKNTRNFTLGCAVNAVSGRSKYSCDIGKVVDLNFPLEYTFDYYIKTDNSGPWKIDVFRCPVSMEIQCSKPTRLKLRPNGRGSLKLSWSPPTDMGDGNAPLLCYFIQYFMADSPRNKYNQSYEDLGKYEYTIKSLFPYKTYHVYLQCALNCAQKRSRKAGPVIATTLEEEPQGVIIFERSFSTNVDLNTRNITVVFKIPEKDKWNGKIKEIRVFCYKNDELYKNITLIEFLQLTGGEEQQHQYIVIFPFLRRDTIYNIKADYCNSVGCSPQSRNQTIYPNPSDKLFHTARQKSSVNLTEEEIIGLSVGLIGAIILVILIILTLRRCRKPHERSLNETIGRLSPVDTSSCDGIEEHDSIVYTKPGYPVSRTSRATLNPETTDFQSASVRSLNSLNLMDGQGGHSTSFKEL